MSTVVVFSGGPLPPHHLRAALHGVTPSLVVAADSGLAAATAAGWRAEVVVGDMDSVDPAALAEAEAAGARIRRHPADKDATDLELALDEVLDLVSPGTPTLVVGSASGRLDHLLGWVGVIGAPRYGALEIEARLGATRLVPVHRHRRLEVPLGATLTLLALHGTATGVRTEGLRWAVPGGVLSTGTTHGVSNEATAATVVIGVDHGVVTVVVPGDDEVADPASDAANDTTMEER